MKISSIFVAFLENTNFTNVSLSMNDYKAHSERDSYLDDLGFFAPIVKA